MSIWHKKIIWKLQLIGRHTLTFLSRLLSNIWPQNLIFLRVSLRSPTSYFVQQSQMTFLWHLRVTLFGESQQQMVDYGARWWSWNLFFVPSLLLVARKFRPSLICFAFLFFFLLFAFLCIAACLLQISFVCGDRQMVCNEWVTEQLKNFRNNFYFLSELQKSP